MLAEGYPYVWELRDGIAGLTITKNETSSTRPCLRFDLCDTVGNSLRGYGHKGYGRFGSQPHGCDSAEVTKALRNTQWYACPREGSPECALEEEYYCGAWGCETLAPWVTNKDPLITLWRVQSTTCKNPRECNPLELCVKEASSEVWTTGQTWGIRLYIYGPDPGALFTLQRVQKPQTLNPIGPNRNQYRPQAPVFNPVTALSSPNEEAKLPPPTQSTLLQESPQDTLLKQVEEVHALINKTDPSLAEDCWLCYKPQPPYYVGLAIWASIGQNETRIRNTTDARGCSWEDPHVTLGDVKGNGTCVIREGFNVTLP